MSTNPMRRSLVLGSASTLATGLLTGAIAADKPATTPRTVRGNRPIRIGFISPQSGPLASFGDGDAYAIGEVRKQLSGGVTVNGARRSVEILDRDSASSPQKARSLALNLIREERVDLMLAASTSLTVNPVADVCEREGVPCITTDNPWQAYFFDRGGKPDRGFKWTYHFFWGLEDAISVFTGLWQAASTNKRVGAMWPLDPEGLAFGMPREGFPAALNSQGYRLVDPGRVDPNTADFSNEIRLFKQANVEILTGVFTPPTFARFWEQAAAQNFRPKVATIAKALLFPQAVASLGPRAKGLTTEVWWSPAFPFRSSLTGQSAAEYCNQFELATGRQWTQPLGFRHALFEVALDVCRRTADLDSREAWIEAVRRTQLETIIGPINWSKGPVKNVCRTPLVGGQWLPGKRFPFDLTIVSNSHASGIPVQQPIALIS